MSLPKGAGTILGALVALFPLSASAQTDPPLLPSRPTTTVTVSVHEISPEQLLEVQRWTTDYEEWKEWFVRWRNRPEPGVFKPRPRRERPDPPAWLADTCAAFVEGEEGPLADGCRAWREWRRGDDAALFMKQQLAQARADKEAPQKTRWWEHIHLDALWPMTQSGSSAFGVFGTHATLQVTRRLGVFLAPGAILMRLPTRDGSRAWSAATDWGFSYRMIDFRMPITHRLSTLHINIARVWILGTNDVQPLGGELYLAGFSVTFKPRPNSPNAR